MAEIAAGAGALLVAEQVVSTTAEVGFVGYHVAKPTLPLSATFTNFAKTDDDEMEQRSLARSNHTLTVIGNKAYIFGGNTSEKDIATNDMHVVTLASSGKPEADYHLIPALPLEEHDEVPAPRTKHAACAFNGRVAIYGGCDAHGQIISDKSSIWFFNPEKNSWTFIRPTNADCLPGPRQNPKLFAHGDQIILYGGEGSSESTSSEVWLCDTVGETWSKIPTAPTSTSSAAFANGNLYLVSSNDALSSQLHHLNLTELDNEEAGWHTFNFPTNPLAPGPRARQGAGLLPITTGYGRNYLVYFLGVVEAPSSSITQPEDKDETQHVTQWSDMWTLQLPSSDMDPKPSFKLSEAFKPAKAKDAIRSAVGAESGKYIWGEVVVQPPTDLQIPEGKLHPGPRGWFGCDVMQDQRSVVIWGGVDAKGERTGDGWIVRLG